MADRKRKLEDEDLNLEKSLKRRKSYSVELKLQLFRRQRYQAIQKLLEGTKLKELVYVNGQKMKKSSLKSCSK